MQDSVRVKRIHSGGMDVESLQIVAGDTKNEFPLAEHGSSRTNLQTWAVPEDEIIIRVDLSFSGINATLTWMKFTTDANNFWEIGTQPKFAETKHTVLFDKETFIGLKSIIENKAIYAVAFLTYDCTGKFQNLTDSLT